MIFICVLFGFSLTKAFKNFSTNKVDLNIEIYKKYKEYLQ